MKCSFQGIGCTLIVSALTLTAHSADYWFGRSFAINSNQTGNQPVCILSTNSLNGMQSVAITSFGTDIWNNSDSGSLYSAPAAGDCEVIATIPPLYKTSDNANIGNYAKAGVMFRNYTLDSSAHILLCRETSTGTTNGTNRARLIARLSDDANTSDLRTVEDEWPADESVRMRLMRKGTVVYAYWSPVGEKNWTLFGERDMGASFGQLGLLAGIAACPQSSGTLSFTAVDIDARQLVQVDPGASSMTVSWDTDHPIPADAVIDSNTVYRTQVGFSGRTPVATTAGNANTFVDSNVEAGYRYVYDVVSHYHTTDAEGAATAADYAVGASMPARIAIDTTNTLTASLTGMANEYYQNGVLVGSTCYQSNTWQPWTNGDNNASIYPNVAGSIGTGITNTTHFSIESQSNFRVPKTGFWRFRLEADDYGTVRIDGVTVVRTKGWGSGYTYSCPIWMEAGRNYFLEWTLVQNDGGCAYSLIANYCDFNGDTSDKWVNNPNYKCEPLPHPWASYDLGRAGRNGTVSYNHETQTFTFQAAGRGFAGDYDEGQIIWRDSPAGDFDVLARVIPATGGDTEAGIVLRDTPRDETSAKFGLLLSGRTVRIISRAGSDSATETLHTQALPEGTFASSAYLRIRRVGSTVNCYVLDGTSRTLDTWIPVGEAIELSDALLGAVPVAFGAASGDYNSLSTTAIDRISFLDYSDISISAVAETAEDGSVTVTFTEASGEIDDANRAAELYGSRINGYFWLSDMLSRYDDTFDVYAHTGIPTNAPTDLVVSGAATGTAIPYTFTTDDPRELTFFTLTPLSGAFGETSYEALPTSLQLGVAQQAPTESGNGLNQIYSTNDWEDGPIASNIVRPGNAAYPNWVAANGNLSVNGMSIGRQNFYGLYSGFLTPPYSGYYRFRIAADDYATLYLNGAALQGNMTRNVSTNENLNYIHTTDWLYLKAGEPLPITSLYRTGSNDTRYGMLQVLWENGSGTGGFTDIPVTALSSAMAASTPVYPDGSESTVFGDWKDLQWGTGMRGIVQMHRTPAERRYDPEELLVTLASCGGGNGIGGTSNNGHLLYREMDAGADFVIRATVSGCNGYQWNARNGLYVAASTNAAAANLSLMRLRWDQSTVYVGARTEEGGATERTEISWPSPEMVDLEIVREGRWLRAYVNGENVRTINIEDWTGPVIVGFAGTSQAAEHMVVTSFHHTEVAYIPPRPTTLLVH